MPQEKSFDAYLDELKTHGFTVVEGVMFSSSFAFIYWLKTKALIQKALKAAAA